MSRYGRDGLPSWGRGSGTAADADGASGLLSGNPPGPGILKQAQKIRDWAKATGISLGSDDEEIPEEASEEASGSSSSSSPWAGYRNPYP